MQQKKNGKKVIEVQICFETTLAVYQNYSDSRMEIDCKNSAKDNALSEHN